MGTVRLKFIAHYESYWGQGFERQRLKAGAKRVCGSTGFRSCIDERKTLVLPMLAGIALL